MIKKFLLILVLFFGICTSAIAGGIKFVQVTDAHFSLASPYTVDVLKKTVKDINTLDGISFVVFSGDNIDVSGEKDLHEFMNIIKDLKVPYYIVIGNHDVFKSGGISKVQYIDIIKQHNPLYRPSSPNYVFKRGEFVFMVVDGAKEAIPGPGGYFRPSTLEWFDKQLTKYKNKPVIVIQHFPLLTTVGGKSHRVYKVEDYLAVLNKHDNVIAVIAGHYHTNNEQMENGVYHIISPSLLSTSNPYKIIDIVTTKGFSPMIYTRLRTTD